MVRDIQLCRKKGLERETEIECCFQIAGSYYQRLQKMLEGAAFASLKDEILFFKKLKPHFLSEMEVAGFYTHAELFRAKATPEDLERFYERELLRLEKFKRDNAEFHQYVISETTDRDKEVFTCLPDEKFKSAYDGLMGTWLALQDYTEFLRRELVFLKQTG